MPYFWNKIEGLKADIERHTTEQLRLEKKIIEYEEALNKTPTEALTNRSLLAYKNLLSLLLDSKAQLTSKIGKNKA